MFPFAIPIVLGVIGLIALVRAGKPTPSTIAGVAQAVSETPAISMLGSYVKVRTIPPPTVIAAAIEEAQAIGRYDLVSQIVRAFIEPVVRSRVAMANTPAPVAQNGAPPPPLASDPPAVQAAAPQPLEAQTAAQTTAIAVAGPSPIAGVADAAWFEFVQRLDREPPTFATERHVGRFRQRKDRLIELGVIDVSTPDKQYEALARDIADSFRHAKAGGLVDEYVSTAVPIENDRGGKTEHAVTLSGLMGLIQAAGLEGAYEWLEKPADRKRFPGTTRMFLHTNGVF